MNYAQKLSIASTGLICAKLGLRLLLGNTGLAFLPFFLSNLREV
jgi:hypothetical protein